MTGRDGLVFHESYGWLLPEQLEAYREHNVSTSDHDSLAEGLGEENREEIVRAVLECRGPAGFDLFRFWVRTGGTPR